MTLEEYQSFVEQIKQYKNLFAWEIEFSFGYAVKFKNSDFVIRFVKFPYHQNFYEFILLKTISNVETNVKIEDELENLHPEIQNLILFNLHILKSAPKDDY